MKRRTFVKSGLAAASGSIAVAACGSSVTTAVPSSAGKGEESGVTIDPVADQSGSLDSQPIGKNPVPDPVPQMGRTNLIKHSVCKWCYPKMSVDQLASSGKQFGLQSIELLDPEDWPALAKHGLTCAMSNPPTVSDRHFIVYGFNRLEHQVRLIPAYEERLKAVANAGYPNLICFSGNREGMDDEQGLDNCVIGLQKVMPLAERLGVTVCMELLNSKVDHGDYQCDHTDWGVELVKRVGSDRFKLLYDIYHMQIMDGDIIRTLTANSEYIGHYHTGGNPGRNEIDETQELNYRAIMQGIVATGYTGYVAQEFIPKNDPMTSLAAAIRLCTV